MGIEIFKRRQQLKRAKEEMKRLPITNFDSFELEGFMGHNSKQFVRIDGSYVSEMYDDIVGNPQNVYRTCLDDLFESKDFTKDEFNRQKISCIIKDYSNEKNGKYLASAELCGSRVANLFGVPTNYVAPIKDNPDKVIVVDFLSGNQTVDNLYDISGSMRLDIYNVAREDVPISMLLNRITQAVQRKIPDHPQKEQQIKQIQTDFIRFYLLRRYVLSDRDLVGFNMGFVHTRKCSDLNSEDFVDLYTNDFSDLHVAPGFDFERCFDLVGVNITNTLETDVKYLAEKFPEQTRESIATFTTKGKERQLRSIFERFDKSGITPKERINCIENAILNIQGYFVQYLDKQNANNMETN